MDDKSVKTMAELRADMLSPKSNALEKERSLRELAKRFFENGQLREAEKAYGILLQAYPDNPSYHGKYGRTLFELGRYREAFDAYELGKKLAVEQRLLPYYTEIVHHRTFAQFKLGLFKPMRADLLKDTQLFPYSVELWFELAFSHMKLHEYDEAIKIFLSVIDAVKKDRSDYISDAKAHIKTAKAQKKSFESAQAEAKKRAAKFQKQKPAKPATTETRDLFLPSEHASSDIALLTLGDTLTHHDFFSTQTAPQENPLDNATVELLLLKPLEPTLLHCDIFFQGQIMGEGAVGVVYRAKYRDQAVAVKTAKLPKDNLHLRNEGSALTGLNHQFIIKFYGASIQNDSILLVTEECDKGSLSRYMYGPNTLNFEWEISLTCKLRWMTQIVCGIEYLHSQQVLHRDLKPDNIFLTGKNWDVRIGDFSIGCKMLSPEAAHVEGEEELPIGSNLMPPQTIMQGTLPFLAPEILYAYLNHIPVLPYCPATDMYSFGILLYCMITGQQPYPHCGEVKQDEEKLKSFAQPILHGEKPEFTKQTPDSIARLIQGIWNLNPFQRPTASQTHKALQEISESESKQMSKEDKAKLPVMRK